MRAQKETLDKLEGKLSKVVSDPQADEALVLQTVEKTEAARAELTKSRTLLTFRMGRILTTDQNVKLKALHEQWVRERRKGSTPPHREVRSADALVRTERNMRKIVCFVAVLGVSTAATLTAQNHAAQDAARTESVVRDAMRAYNDAMKSVDQPPTGTDPQSPTGRRRPGGLRELTLEDSVELALDQNLDIQVSRLEPQSGDLPVDRLPQHLPSGR